MEPPVNLNNDHGFTLIEFCMAVLILTVGLLGLLQATSVATTSNLGTILRNEAISLADEQMVLTKATVADSTTYAAIGNSTATVSRQTRNSFFNYSVSRVVSVASSNSKEVVVRVSWRHKGAKLNHSISSLIVSP